VELRPPACFALSVNRPPVGFALPINFAVTVMVG